MRTQNTPVTPARAAKAAGEKTTTAAARLPFSSGTSLATLSGERPRTKAGQVQWLWPQIKCALREGHKIKDIWECLVADGLELSYSRLRWYIARLKRLEAAGAAEPTLPPAQERAPVLVNHAEPSTRLTRRDPLANLRDRLNKRPGFEFDERPPDEKKLI
jgi:hypothetical protein